MMPDSTMWSPQVSIATPPARWSRMVSMMESFGETRCRRAGKSVAPAVAAAAGSGRGDRLLGIEDGWCWVADGGAVFQYQQVVLRKTQRHRLARFRQREGWVVEQVEAEHRFFEA